MQRYPDQSQIDGVRINSMRQLEEFRAPTWLFKFNDILMSIPSVGLEYLGPPAHVVRIYCTEDGVIEMMGVHSAIYRMLKRTYRNYDWLEPSACVFTLNQFLSVEDGEDVWYPSWEARIGRTVDTPAVAGPIIRAWMEGLTEYLRVGPR